MLINSQGFGHFTDGINNQDFGLENSRSVIVLDGCSGAKFSESGTRFFAQLFSKKEECDSVEKFEDNVKDVFDDIIEFMKKYYPNEESFEKDFIMENLLFTIIACFETEDKYIVKLFGDGYIVTQNANGCVSFMKFSYGKYPPYYAYRYCDSLPKDSPFKTHTFKTFEFDKKKFPKLAIASDGILPIARGDINLSPKSIFEENNALLRLSLINNRAKFNDDVTIAVIGGKK